MKFPRFSNLYKIGIRFPRSVLVIAVLLAIVSCYFAKKLKVETDFSKLLPPETASVKNLNKLTDYFGSMGYLYLTVESQNRSLAEAFADKFSVQVEKLPSVRYVDYRQPVEFFKKRKWLYVDLADLEEMEHRVDRSLVLQSKGVSPVFSSFMDFADPEDRPDLTFQDIEEKYRKKFGDNEKEITSGEEGRFIILRVKAKRGAEDFAANRALVTDIRNIEKALKQDKNFQTIKVGYAGSYLTSIEAEDLIHHEMAWVSLGVGFILILILVLYFRRASGAFLVGFPLALGVIWTGGLVYFILGHVNIVTAFSISILAGLGSDYGIYLLSRFTKEKERCGDFSQACRLAFHQTGKATFGSMITTIGAFGALIFSGFDVFIEFGWVGCVGLFINYLAMMLIMPSLLKLADLYPRNLLISWVAGWKTKLKSPENFRIPFLQKIFTLRHAGLVVSLALILTVLSAFSLPKESKIYFENGEMDYDKIPSNQLYGRISDTVGTSLHPSVLIVEGREAEKKTVEELNKQLENASNKSLVFEKVVGLSSFIPRDQDEKKAILKRLVRKYSQNRYVNNGQKKKFISDVRASLEAKPVVMEDLPWEVRRMFLSPKDKNVFAVYVFPAVSRMDSKGMEEYNSGILKARTKTGVDFTPVDGSFVSLDIINLISREAPEGLLLVMLFLSGVLFLTLRDFKRSLLILSNLVAGLILLSGLLYLLGMKLNILNIAVLPIILGTGVDSYIHFNHRYEENGNLLGAMQNQFPSILISNLTSIVGFGGLIFTSGVGLRSIGWVSVLGLVIVTLICLFVFPRCLFLALPKKLRAFKVNPKIQEI